MILAFFLGRIIFIPYFYFKAFSVWSYPQRRTLGPILSLIWISTAGILDIINVYWFYKMLKGGAKLLWKPGQEKKSKQRQPRSHESLDSTLSAYTTPRHKVFSTKYVYSKIRVLKSGKVKTILIRTVVFKAQISYRDQHAFTSRENQTSAPSPYFLHV